jgi:uncharacterized protein with PQ loop repeat
VTANATPDRRLKRAYLSAALAIAVILFAGFAKNYYLRLWLSTRPIVALDHIHGLVMTAWVLLFLAQTWLIASRRSDLHRKLGVAGAAVAAIVVTLGVYTIAFSIFRHEKNAGVGLFALLFVAFDGLSLLLFSGFVIMALRARLRPQTHKRLMLMAMIALLPPAFGRLVAYFTHSGVQAIVLTLMCAAVLLCVGIDTLRHRRLHPALAWSGALVIAVNVLTYFAQTVD